VDEHVVDAWCQEVRERGEKWLEASKLLAAYGYGIPKDTATEEQMRTIEGESSVTPARALQALDDAPLTPEPRGPDDSDH
jgi:hypothetical protein